jgi:hypothetical protein
MGFSIKSVTKAVKSAASSAVSSVSSAVSSAVSSVSNVASGAVTNISNFSQNPMAQQLVSAGVGALTAAYLGPAAGAGLSAGTSALMGLAGGGGVEGALGGALAGVDASVSESFGLSPLALLSGGFSSPAPAPASAADYSGSALSALGGPVPAYLYPDGVSSPATPSAGGFSLPLVAVLGAVAFIFLKKR